MQPDDARSLSDLVDLAKRRLAEGSPEGVVRAVLAIGERDPVCIRAVPNPRGGTPVVSYLFNGHPIRKEALRLLLAIHGAALQPQQEPGRIT